MHTVLSITMVASCVGSGLLALRQLRRGCKMWAAVSALLSAGSLLLAAHFAAQETDVRTVWHGRLDRGLMDTWAAIAILGLVAYVVAASGRKKDSTGR